jgi:hypothetical protein
VPQTIPSENSRNSASVIWLPRSNGNTLPEWTMKARARCNRKRARPRAAEKRYKDNSGIKRNEWQRLINNQTDALGGRRLRRRRCATFFLLLR